MAKLIYSQSLAGFKSAFPNYKTATDSSYKAVCFSDDGYLITHGKIFELALNSEDNPHGLAVKSTDGKITVAVGAKSATADLGISAESPISYTSGKITHATSGVVPNTYGTAPASISAGSTGTIKIPQLTINEYGHVTTATTISCDITIPNISTFVSGSGLTADKIILGNGSQTIKTSSYSISESTSAISGSSTDSTIPTSKAVWNAVSSGIEASEAMVFKGALQGGSTTAYTPAANRGDTYKVSTAGLINGISCEVGDTFICTNDNTPAATASNLATDVTPYWIVLQTNLINPVTSTGTLTSGNVIIGAGNNTLASSSYTINKSVPADAKFTDTTYTAGTGLSLNNTEFSLKVTTATTLGGIIASNVVTPSPSIIGAGTTAGRYYGVQVSNTGNAFVNIPWTDTTYSAATTTALGLVKVQTTTATSSLVSATSTPSRSYGLSIGSDGVAFVNVPWVNTTYTAGTGLSLSGTVFSLKAATATATTGLGGIIASKVVTTSPTIIADGATADRYYGVQVDSTGNAFVNIPWVNTWRPVYAWKVSEMGTANDTIDELLSSTPPSTETANLIFGPTFASDSNNQIDLVWAEVSDEGHVTYSL